MGVLDELLGLDGNSMSNALYNNARKYLLGFTYAKGPINFKDLSNHFRNKKAELQYHLGILENAKLIRKDGEEMSYSVTDTGSRLLDLLGVKDFIDKAKPF